MANLKLTAEEREYMAGLPYLDAEYIEYLSQFRYNPDEQVKIQYDASTSDLQLEITGEWHETILYEVPVLALISEAYFRFTDRDWNYDNQVEHTVEKTRALIEHGCVFSEFGTRRRRDFKTHDIVMGAIHKTDKEYKEECAAKGQQPKGFCAGTSNVYLAMKYNVAPIGTVGKLKKRTVVGGI